MGKTLTPTWSDCVIGVVVIILFCVTLLLNILALHYTYSKIRKPSNKKIPHLLVGALSLAGLGIALFQYPPFIASRFKGEWLYNSGVCSFVAFVIVLFGNLTICMVVLMSLERLGAIVFPFFYKEYVNFRKAVIIVLFLVGYSVFLASLPLFLDRIRLNVSTGVCTYAVDTYNTNTKIVVAVMVTHYIASIIVMFVANMIVVRTVSMLDRNTMSGEYESRCGERKQHSTHACLNFAKMVGVLAFCYTICWTVILLRILLLYVYGWRNYYYDQVVIVLTTFDPLINHCVCLWIMRRYRDGYASSMGSIMSCFKISDDGIWATTITRLSTISRRSTYSRASTRSSQSRQSSKPYFYKQVPQNAENPNQDISPEGEEIPDQTFKNQDRDIGGKGVSSDGKREWSEIIRELKAEKEVHDENPLSPDDIHIVEKDALPRDSESLEQREISLKTALQKPKSTKAENQDPSKPLHHDVLVTLHEQREDTSEHQSTDEPKIDVLPQKEGIGRSRENTTEYDAEEKKKWTTIVDTLSKQEKPKDSTSTQDKQPSVPTKLEEDESNLPELLQELKTAKSEDEPELLKHGSTSKRGERSRERQADLPEIVQDVASKDDSTPSDTSMSSEPRDIQSERDQESIGQSLKDASQSDQED